VHTESNRHTTEDGGGNQHKKPRNNTDYVNIKLHNTGLRQHITLPYCIGPESPL